MSDVQVCAGVLSGWRNQESKGARETKISKSWGKQVSVYCLEVTVLDFSSETVVSLLVKNHSKHSLTDRFRFSNLHWHLFVFKDPNFALRFRRNIVVV